MTQMTMGLTSSEAMTLVMVPDDAPGPSWLIIDQANAEMRILADRLGRLGA